MYAEHHPDPAPFTAMLPTKEGHPNWVPLGVGVWLPVRGVVACAARGVDHVAGAGFRGRTQSSGNDRLVGCRVPTTGPVEDAASK
jgi:hypothetical protein